MTFENLPIKKDILKALQDEGYQTPTPIQEQAIPILMQGKDVLGSAQTGTGKTAAFAIPILQGLSLMPKTKAIKALILAPTRELAAQINDSFKAYGKHMHLTSAVVFGGVAQGPQTQAIRRGVDILIATPGRLLDLIDQGIINISSISYLVLDEADRMLDMGFIHDVKKIISFVPGQRQTMLFSATLPNEILELSKVLLKDPVRISVVPVEATLDIITQKLYKVKKPDKTALLAYLLGQPEVTSALVFTRTKQFANRLAKALEQQGFSVDAIHGNKSQSARTLALSNFKKSRTAVLVATDIAARGLDIEGLSHVVNFDLPEVPETYIHRIGRTGRAGFSGTSISFQTPEEERYLKDIEKHIGMKIPVIYYDIKAVMEKQQVTNQGQEKAVEASTKETKVSKQKETHKVFTDQKPKSVEKKVQQKPVEKKAEPKSVEKKVQSKTFEKKDQQKPFEKKVQSKTFEKKDQQKPFEKKFPPKPETKDKGTTFQTSKNNDKRPNKSNDRPFKKRENNDRESFRSKERSQRPDNRPKHPSHSDDRRPAKDLRPRKPETKDVSKESDNIIDGKVVTRYNRHDYHHNRGALAKSNQKEQE